MLSYLADLFESTFDAIYSDYEKWLIVPLLILVFALGVIGYNYAAHGEMTAKGIDFTGGTEIQIQVTQDVQQAEIERIFGEEFESVNVRTLGNDEERWMLIETKDAVEDGQSAITGNQTDTSQINASQDIARILDDNNVPYQGDISIRTMGAAVSESFLFEAQLATLIAFLIMSVAIFVAFRNFVPSMAVIFAAFTDIVFAIAGMNLFGVELTLGSLAALLMLIGYSVDTDIVLSTRVLKERKGDLQDRIRRSTATGMTMSLGAIVSFIVLFLVSTSPVLDQIAAVIIIGLLADIPITWLGNAVVLKMHVEGKI